MKGMLTQRSVKRDEPIIILVEPQLPENIGMVARAMANFGLSYLRIIKPRHGWPQEKASVTAAHGSYILENAEIFSDLESAISDLHFIFASTARKRDDFKPIRSADTFAPILRERIALGQKTAILFGRERCGLFKEDVKFADEIITFSVNPDCPSLNVAQAVLLIAYEWMKSESNLKRIVETKKKELPATKEQMHAFLSHLESALGVRGYFRTLERKDKMIQDLRTVLTRPGFSATELKLLQGMMSSLDYFSASSPRGAGYPERKERVDCAAHGKGEHKKGDISS